MNAVPSQFNDTHRTGRGRAFSMVELLVVIAIIAVLAGILLVALKGVRERALATQTRATMQEFSKACDSFQIEHGRYPGVIPETVLAAFPEISGTENAILHMMGGYRVLSPFDDPTGPVGVEYDNYGDCNDPNIRCITFGDTDWELKVDVLRIGEGPMINGTPYAPYFTPKGDELRVAKGQRLAADDRDESCPDSGWCLPDLLDAWGQQISYSRRSRPVGNLAGIDDSTNPQFMLGSMKPYINSGGLGELGRDQGHPTKGSILKLAQDPSATFAQIIRHPSFGAPNDPLNGTARGAYVLISTGKDGVYFSVADGPGTPGNPVEDIVTGQFGNPQVVEEYDDIRLFGGG